mmetsp:Transcript_55290/g.155163  ORF Transcript_55290/g.155163 Transcript_55290/m.155163 type:complete len:208 (+) Transcript_55290:227-850(+)
MLLLQVLRKLGGVAGLLQLLQLERLRQDELLPRPDQEHHHDEAKCEFRHALVGFIQVGDIRDGAVEAVLPTKADHEGDGGNDLVNDLFGFLGLTWVLRVRLHPVGDLVQVDGDEHGDGGEGERQEDAGGDRQHVESEEARAGLRHPSAARAPEETPSEHHGQGVHDAGAQLFQVTLLVVMPMAMLMTVGSLLGLAQERQADGQAHAD